MTDGIAEARTCNCKEVRLQNSEHGLKHVNKRGLNQKSLGDRVWKNGFQWVRQMGFDGKGGQRV